MKFSDTFVNLKSDKMYKNLISVTNLPVILIFLFSFSIPFHQKFSTLILVTFFAITLFYFKTAVFRRELMVLALLYLLYILFDVLNSGDFHFKVFEMKASLLVFPFIFSLANYNTTVIRNVFKSFVIGCFAAAIICYSYACYQSIHFVEGGLSFSPFVSGSSSDTLFLSSIREGNYFFGSHFSIFHQTVYFAMYLNIAVILLLCFDFFSKKIRILLTVFFAIAIFQISNRINLIVLPFSFIFYVLFFTRNKVFKGIFVFLVVAIGSGLIITNPRFSNVYKQLQNHQINLDRESHDSLGTRLLVWDASLELIAGHFLTGVGITNSKESLKSSYKSKRYVIPYRYELNAHNQFLQIAIECGILGLIILVVQLVYNPLRWFNFLTVGIAFIFVVNFLFESMLSRYSGIVCYAFFYCLLSSGNLSVGKRELPGN